MSNTEPHDPITGEIISSRPRFRTAYDHGNIRTKIIFDPESSMTKQEFKDQCDVNLLVAAFMRTGDASLLEKARGSYLDMTAIPASYQDALNLVIEARNTFDLLPAAVRAQYNNDVQTFLDAAYHDPDAVFGTKPHPAPPQDPSATPVPENTPPASTAPAAPATAASQNPTT